VETLDNYSQLQAIETAPMREYDLDEILLIEQSGFAVPWTRQMFLDELNVPRARQTILKADGKIVGYFCFRTVLDETHLFNIAVHPVTRGKGYGKFMMAMLEKISKEMGMNRIILEVRRGNAAARALYRICGFSSVGFRKMYYAAEKEDAIIMEKWVGEGEESS
jgi:[ribosomal protein S18]-alanine N-acetyltransferase